MNADQALVIVGSRIERHDHAAQLAAAVLRDVVSAAHVAVKGAPREFGPGDALRFALTGAGR